MVFDGTRLDTMPAGSRRRRSSSAGNIVIRPPDNIFEPTIPQAREPEQEQYPSTLSLRQLNPFPNHPFQVRHDKELEELAKSIRENGLLEPILCRPDPAGNGFQIVSGHRRAEACQMAGLTEVPVHVEEMEDDRAIVTMVDSNLHREKILPSEKAFSFKMKLDALNRRRSEEGLVVSGVATRIVGEESGENYRNVMRYMRLTHLERPLLELVDEGKIKLHPAVELSYLKATEQNRLITIITNSNMKIMPSLQQARQLKVISQNGELTKEDLEDVLIEKNVPARSLSFKLDELREYFPESYTTEQIKACILETLSSRQRDRAMVR